MALFPNAEAFRDHVEKHKDTFLLDLLLGFKSEMELTSEGGNKGELIEKKLSYERDVLQPWARLQASDFAQKGDIGQISMKSHLVQFRDVYYPTELERSYLGAMRKSGQDPHDFPFMQYFLQEAARTIRNNIEKMVWAAKKLVTPVTGMDIYDGILEQIKAAVAASDIAVQALGTPVIRAVGGSAAAGELGYVDYFEQMFDALPEELKEMGVKIYCAPKHAQGYSYDYRNIHRLGATVDPNLDRMILDSSQNYHGDAVFCPVPGLIGSDRIIMTPMSNAYYTYDDAADAANFNIYEYFNGTFMWSDLRVGSGIKRLEDAWVVINDLE